MNAKLLNIATVCTFSRIALIPFIIVAITQQSWLFATCCFIVAGVTDFLDGFLARALGKETEFGAWLDPLADKLLVLSCYGALMISGNGMYDIPRWFVLLAIARDMVIVVGAVGLGFFGRCVSIKPTLLGKMTTLVQIIFMSVLFLCLALHLHVVVVLDVLFCTAVVFVALSFVQYIFIGLQGLYRCFAKDIFL